jgi:parallel beta-helix repeat protein
VGAVLSGLSPGQVACLTSGSYAGNFAIRVSGVTLTAAAGASPVVNGYIEVTDSANDVTVSSTTVNGASSPQNTLQIWGDRFHLLNSNINGGHSSTTQDCIFLGHPSYGLAYNALIDHNRIHDCGVSGHGHGLYLKASRNATITNNYIYDNESFGLQFYDDADGTIFEHNVIDGAHTNAGLIFAGETTTTSDNNVVRFNIITSNTTYGITSWWGGPIGQGNVASNNCLWSNASGPFGDRTGWSDGGGDVFADPLYVNRAANDFRLRAGSPCAGDGPS